MDELGGGRFVSMEFLILKRKIDRTRVRRFWERPNATKFPHQFREDVVRIYYLVHSTPSKLAHYRLDQLLWDFF